MNFSQRLTEAATWTLLADLMRRHEAAHGLRLIETHPGGGQYDCRTLLRPAAGDYGSLVHFNLQSGNATVFGTIGKPAPLPELVGVETEDDRVAYIAAILQAEDRRPVRHWLEARIGLPPVLYPPKWTRHALSYGVMAGVAARFAFLGPRVRWENGFIDTSGYGPDDPIRPEVRMVPALAERLRIMGELPTPAHHPAYEVWLLMVATRSEGPFKAVAALGIDAQLYSLAAPDVPADLFSECQGGGKLDPLVERVAKLVASNGIIGDMGA